MAKTVLLTGTSSGIGEAAAWAFLEDGWNVVATARRAEAAAAGPAHERLLRLRLDVTEPATIDAALSEAEACFGAVDVVVNNAGAGLAGVVEALPLEAWREHLEVNLLGAVAVCQAAIPRMRARGEGLLVNVSSMAGRVGLPFLAPYCAGKFALEGFSEALRFELKAHGVRVKLVEPGGVRTGFSHPWTGHEAYPAGDAMNRRMQTGNAGSAPPEDVAKVIVAAARDPSDRLRYTATDAGTALRMHRLLPEAAWRGQLEKSFGLTAA